MSQRLRAVGLAAALALSITAGARAADVTVPQMRALATRAAAGDSGALAALRGVGAVDGHPTAIGTALNAASTADLRARLLALAAAGPVGGLSPAAAQRAAASILAAGRYAHAPVPDPVSTGLDKLGRLIARLAAGTPGGAALFWAVAAALVLAVAGLGARRMLRRLEPLSRGSAVPDGPSGEDPSSLEREARAAEARGAFGEAVRLRFRAGLLLLSSRNAIDYRPSLLTAEVAGRLHSAQFDALASSFERIAYGGARAAQADAAAARDGWTLLLDQKASG